MAVLKTQFQYLLLPILLFLFSGAKCAAQGIKLALPLKGIPGKDYWIDYYIDHDQGSQIKDWMCGGKTYDGHSGTDFLIRSFNTMDSGVVVYSVYDGVIYKVRDGLFDRSKRWTSGDYGNYISIMHEGGYITYYAHLKKNSILVKQGDTVKSGQAIAMVGSSGYSVYPHLHFEIKANNKLIDPFSGRCNDLHESYWAAQPAYDTAVYAIDNGFTPYIPNVDTLQERFLVTDTFRISTDTTVCFWIQMHGLRAGDSTYIEWFSPNGKLWFRYNYRWTTNWWFDYTWFYIKMPGTKGTWTAKYTVNNRLMASRNFYVTE